jgi:hypothetical protein
MIAGYILHRTKNPPKVPFLVNIGLWLVSIAITFALVFGVWDGQLGTTATAFYVSVGHTAWGFALIWITLSCAWGYGGIVNSILSYRGFFPLSRLTYCAYLIHPVLFSLPSIFLQAPLPLNPFMIVGLS